MTGQWYVRSDGNKVYFGTSSGCVGPKGARRENSDWPASLFFYLRTLIDCVRTRQRQIDLLKKCGAESSRVHGHAPIALPIRTAQHCGSNRLPIQVQTLLGSMRASMQGLGCVRNIYQQVAYLTYVNLKNAKV